jgi:hypothetical protein
MIRLHLFKEKKGRSPLGRRWKEKEKVLMLGGQWKEKEKLPMFGGQWRGKEKLPMLGGQWKEKEKVPFYLFSFSPQQILLFFLHFFFPLILTFYFTMVLIVTYAFPRFPLPINYGCAFNVTSSPHFIVDSIWLKISFFFLEIMASRMATSYKLQAAQTIEELAPESSLDLTLMQHPRDEEPKSQKVCVRFEINPPQAWYYRISLNFPTLVILLQIDLVSNGEPETVYEGCYETEDTFIFTWSSIFGVGHYRWLRSSIRRLSPNSKAYYLVRTIRRILPSSHHSTHTSFLTVMNYHYGIH